MRLVRAIPSEARFEFERRRERMVDVLPRFEGDGTNGYRVAQFTVEPKQFAEKKVAIHEQTQPLYIEGYHRPSYRDPDDAVYDAISDILSNGRVSRLYRSLVRDQQIAAEAAGFSGYPGQKYPGLFAFIAIPLPGHTPALQGLRLDLTNSGTFFLTSDQFHLADNYAGPQPLGWLLRDHAAWWRSYRKVKTLADRTGARLVFGHDADVLAELRREEFYD